MYKLTQDQLNTLAQIIFNAKHDKYSFAEIQNVIKMLNRLPEIEQEKPESEPDEKPDPKPKK